MQVNSVSDFIDTFAPLLAALQSSEVWRSLYAPPFTVKLVPVELSGSIGEASVIVIDNFGYETGAYLMDGQLRFFYHCDECGLQLVNATTITICENCDSNHRREDEQVQREGFEAWRKS